MASKITKVYPVRGRFLMGVPAAVHSVPTKADADALVASGAFTTNAHDADRDDEAPELEGEPVEHQATSFFGESPQAVGEAGPETVSPSTEEE